MNAELQALSWVLDEIRRGQAGLPPSVCMPPDLSAKAFLGLISRNRLAPFMNLRLALENSDVHWEQVQKSLMAAYQANLVRGLHAMATSCELMNRLSDQGVRCLMLRGPVMGGGLFEDIGARTFGDVDLLIPSAQKRVALEVGMGLGYKLYPGWLSAAFIEKFHLHWRLHHHEHHVPCELHWALDHRYKLQTVDYDAIFRDAVVCTAQGFRWEQPSPLHLFIVSCMHLNKHHRFSLADVGRVDFVERLARRGELRRWVDVMAMQACSAERQDMGQVLQLAGEWGGELDVRVVMSGLNRLCHYDAQADRHVVQVPCAEHSDTMGRLGFRNVCLRDVGRFILPGREWFARSGKPSSWICRARHALQAVGHLAMDAISAAGMLLFQRPLRGVVAGAFLCTAATLSAHEFGDDIGDNAATAKPLILNSNTVGRIEIDIDQDWFSFTASNSLKEYVITVSTGTLWNSTAGMVGPDGRGALGTTDSVASTASQVSWIHLGPPATYFVRVGGFSQFTTGTYSVVVSERSFLDQDADGMPDAWEQSTMGSAGQSPTADFDHDGVDNLHEFLAGTNPSDSNSCLRIEAFAADTTRSGVAWSAAPYRTYDVEVCTNLAAGGWARLGTVTNLQAMDTVLFDDANAGLSSVRFYRIKCLY